MYLELMPYQKLMAARRKIPEHLWPLLSLTPSGYKKLLAAWDGLTVESQIQILDWLTFTGHKDEHQLYFKSLESKNPYIRYLGARKLRHYIPMEYFEMQTEDISQFSPDEAKEMIDALYSDYSADEDARDLYTIESFWAAYRVWVDPSPLVRWALEDKSMILLSSCVSGYDGKKFFSLPRDQRLAMVRDVEPYSSEIFEFVSYAIDEVSKGNESLERDVREMIRDFFAVGTNFNGVNENGELEPLQPLYGMATDYDPFWKLVKSSYNDDSLSGIGFELMMSLPVISNKSFIDVILSADEEFIRNSGYYCKALRLVHYDMIADQSSERESVTGASSRYSILCPDAKKRELEELKRYRLAKKLATSGEIPDEFRTAFGLPKTLSELENIIIPGKVLETFLNLESKRLPDSVELPIITEIEGDPDDLPYKPPPIDRMIDDTKTILMEKLESQERKIVQLTSNATFVREKLSRMEERQKVESDNIRNDIERCTIYAPDKFPAGLTIMALLCALILWKVW